MGLGHENKIIIHRMIDGISVHGHAVYDEGRGIWRCTSTDHFGEQHVGHASNAWHELMDMIDMALAQSRQRLDAPTET